MTKRNKCIQKLIHRGTFVAIDDDFIETMNQTHNLLMQEENKKVYDKADMLLKSRDDFSSLVVKPETPKKSATEKKAEFFIGKYISRDEQYNQYQIHLMTED
jgi:hypothetical protein